MLIDLGGPVVGLVFAASSVLGFRALALFLRRAWRAGAFHLLGALGCSLLGVGSIVAVAIFGARAAELTDPTLQGRRIAAIAIDVAYDATWVALLGVPVGLVVAILTYRKLGRETTSWR